MQKLIVKGKKKLSGSINISGSKNATLPILASALLSNKDITLKNIPLVQDVYTMINLLKFIGLNIKISKKEISDDQFINLTKVEDLLEEIIVSFKETM